MLISSNASLPLNVAEMNMPVYAVCKQIASGHRAPTSNTDISTYNCYALFISGNMHYDVMHCNVVPCNAL